MNKKPVAVITGASRGIGAAVAKWLARDGYNIVGLARTLNGNDKKKGLNDLTDEIISQGVEFLPIVFDAAKIETHQKMIDTVIAKFGRIDLLINNVGVAPRNRLDVLKTSPESYDRLMNINLRGPFFLSQKIAPIMIKQHRILKNYQPSIIFIGSLSARVSSTSRAEYCISKAGLSMAARVFADKLAGEKINVYEIRPGIIATDMTLSVKDKYDKLIAEGLIPQGRWGKVEDVADAVSALARGDFGYSTGIVIELSGGMNIPSL